MIKPKTLDDIANEIANKKIEFEIAKNQPKELIITVIIQHHYPKDSLIYSETDCPV